MTPSPALRVMVAGFNRPRPCPGPACLAALVVSLVLNAGAPLQSLDVEIRWGHQSPAVRPFFVRLSGTDVTLTDLRPLQFEPADQWQAGSARTTAGAGDVDGLALRLRFEERSVQSVTNVHSIWAHLLDHSDADTVRRLRLDPGFRPDARRLTVWLDEDGARGFSVTVDQLLREKAFWVPEYNIFLSAGVPPASYAAHQAALQPWRGRRILDQVDRDDEATYEAFTSRWEDMGSPTYRNPASVPPGHIVGLTWDGALYKFGVDRAAAVRNDYGKADRFEFRFGFVDLSSPGFAKAWKGQQLEDGLPVITPRLEEGGVRYEVEQFAYPLHGPPVERRGDIVAEVGAPGRRTPESLVIRFRHPGRRPIRRVAVNSRAWSDFDAAKESVRIERPNAGDCRIVVSY